MAGLALLGKDQDGFRVLVLDPRQRLLGEFGDVEGQLTRGVRVQPRTHRVRDRADLRVRGAASQQSADLPYVRFGQHVRLREH